jgi:hypothetical protein
MAYKRFTMLADKVDQVDFVGSGTGDLRITSGVGRGTPPLCRNLPDDVRTIQRALNRYPAIDGGAKPKLVVDGICGPKTKGAIDHFQAKHQIFIKGTKNPDGIVEPNGQTIAKLRQGPSGIADMPAEFFRHIADAQAKVTAASAVITLAAFRLAHGKGSLGGSAIPAAVQKHFKMSQWKTPALKSSALSRIQRVFLGMQTAIGHVPQGRILALQEPAEHAQGSYMFTFGGGFHDAPSERTDDGLPTGTIYLCPPARDLNGDQFVYGMIHELAHFVGPQSDNPNMIDDLAYFHVSPSRYRDLLADQTLRNGDSYSQFVFEVAGKPDFRID